MQIRHEAQFGLGRFFQEPGEIAREAGVNRAVWGSIFEVETLGGHLNPGNKAFIRELCSLVACGILRTMRRNWAIRRAEGQAPLPGNRIKASGNCGENWNPR